MDEYPYREAGQDGDGRPEDLPPERIALRARPQPVQRLNRKVLGLLAAVLCALLFVAVFFGLGSDEQRKALPAAETRRPRAGSRVLLEELTALPTGYDEMAPPEVDVPVTPPVRVARAPVDGAAKAREEARRTAREELDKARNSPLFFRTQGRGEAAPATAPAPPRPGQRPVLPSLPQAPPAPLVTSGAEENMQREKRAFLAAAQEGTAAYLPQRLQDPVSPYEVKTGTIIPAVLLTGIASDLPGEIIAQVREPVYDTVTGRYLLIPQGTRLIGAYDSVIASGQNRVLVVWRRLLFPDGGSLALGGMPGVDLAGFAGLRDRVNHHLGPLLGSVVLSSVLGIGARAAQGSVAADRFVPSLGQEFAQDASQGVNDAGQRIVARQLNRQPTITIRPGWAFNVFVNRDMVLRPYEGG